MTAYQNFWNAEIESLLHEIDAPQSLHDNIVDTLNNSKRTGIFSNQIVNALRLGISIKQGHINMAFVASMQSGKSGTIYFLCNYILPAIGFIDEYESILFVTSMRDTDLYDQNCRVLEQDYFDVSKKSMQQSVIKVMKMNEFFKSPNPHKVVKDFKVKLVIRDEDQYGSGVESSFEITFFDELRNRMKDIKLLAVSATPYDILDAHIKEEAEIDVIVGVRPPQYYGITEMLEDNRIEDLPDGFKPIQHQKSKGEKIFNLHPKTISYVDYLNTFESGLGIIRESSTSRALELRNLLKKAYNDEFELILIGSDSACDFSIKEGIKELYDLILKRGKRVVLIIVQALTAGKDLGMIKEKVRFGIEPRDKQLANGAQGIAGRFCGYHNNRSFKLLASKSILEHYSKFEQDWEIFADEEWRNELYNAKVKGLSTHTKIVQENSAGIYIPVEDIKTLTYDNLKSEDGRKKLSFIDDDAYERLLDYFESDFYNFHSKGVRFKQEGVTVRIASGYNQNSNRVYRNWDCNLNADFGNIFFKKNQYEFGILISNYPADDHRNQLGFTGIKILKSGVLHWRSLKTNTDNGSMYGSDEAA